jgi:hypothetical protein
MKLTFSLIEPILSSLFFHEREWPIYPERRTVINYLYNSFLHDRNIAMKNKRFAAFLCKLILSLGVCALISCSKSPFDSSTDLGKNIVDDFDPGITNLQSNVKTFSGHAEIDSAFSMRDSGDSIVSWLQRNTSATSTISTLASGTFQGLTVDGFNPIESVFTYIEFRPDTLRTTEATRKMLDTAYSIDSVVFVVNRLRMTIDSSSAGMASPAGIDMYPCDTLKDSAAFVLDRNKIRYNIGRLGTFTVSLDSSAADTVYSAKLDSAAYIPRIRKAVKDSAPDTSWFAFCLRPSPNSRGIVRFDNYIDLPRILVYYRASSSDSTQTVVLYRNHASFSVFESDSLAACRYPFSTWETGRRTVFKLNLASLRAFMDTAADSGKKFMIIQRADLKINLSGIISDLSDDSVRVYFNFSDTLAHTSKDFSSLSLFYEKRAGSKNAVYTFPVTSWLQKLIAEHKIDTVYLYLTALTPTLNSGYSSFIQIDWTQPSARLELNAIVTNPR